VRGNLCVSSTPSTTPFTICVREDVIVVDDEDRENEGDFVCAAEFVTPAVINFLAVNGRGIICAPLESARAEALGLMPMVDVNTSLHETPFTVSVDVLHGTSHRHLCRPTGQRRCGRLADPSTEPSDLAGPGTSSRSEP